MLSQRGVMLVDASHGLRDGSGDAGSRPLRKGGSAAIATTEADGTGQLPLIIMPSAGAFFGKAGPALAAYGPGDREGAMAQFSSASLTGCTCSRPEPVARGVAGFLARHAMSGNG